MARLGTLRLFWRCSVLAIAEQTSNFSDSHRIVANTGVLPFDTTEQVPAMSPMIKFSGLLAIFVATFLSIAEGKVRAPGITRQDDGDEHRQLKATKIPKMSKNARIFISELHYDNVGTDSDGKRP